MPSKTSKTQKKTKSSKEEQEEASCRYNCWWPITAAILARFVFFIHAFLAVWRTVAVKAEPLYWLLGIPAFLLIGEGVLRLALKRGQEWRLWSPCFLLFIISVAPAICVIELQHAAVLRGAVNQTYDAQTVIDLGVAVSDEEWSLIIVQGALVTIIVNRWLLPRGDLTRSQLSQTLFLFLATASDEVDFASLFEERGVWEDEAFSITVLIVFIWSLFQFVIVLPVLTESEPWDSEKSNSIQIRDDEINSPSITECVRKWCRHRRLLALFVPLCFQDIPFLVMRLIAIFMLNVRSYTTYFFTAKNIIVFLLQFYTLVIMTCLNDKTNEAEKVGKAVATNELAGKDRRKKKEKEKIENEKEYVFGSDEEQKKRKKKKKKKSSERDEEQESRKKRKHKIGSPPPDYDTDLTPVHD